MSLEVTELRMAAALVARAAPEGEGVAKAFDEAYEIVAAATAGTDTAADDWVADTLAAAWDIAAARHRRGADLAALLATFAAAHRAVVARARAPVAKRRKPRRDA